MPESYALRIYRKYGGLLYRLALAITGSPESAADVVFQVCATPYDEKDRLPGWVTLVSTARSIALAHARHQNDPPPGPTMPQGEEDIVPFIASDIFDAYRALEEEDQILLWRMLVAPHHGPAPVSALARAMQRFQAVLANQSIPEDEELP